MAKKSIETIKTIVFFSIWLAIAISFKLSSGSGVESVYSASILIGLVGVLIFGKHRFLFWLFEFFAFAIFLITFILLEFFGRQNLLIFILSIINFASPFLLKRRIYNPSRTGADSKESRPLFSRGISGRKKEESL